MLQSRASLHGVGLYGLIDAQRGEQAKNFAVPSKDVPTPDFRYIIRGSAEFDDLVAMLLRWCLRQASRAKRKANKFDGT